MGATKFLAKLLFFLLVLTLIGQLRWSGISLENYYHTAVNSENFQTGWATVTAPFKWVGGRFGLSKETSRPESAR
jgi:hypothetical protein